MRSGALRCCIALPALGLALAAAPRTARAEDIDEGIPFRSVVLQGALDGVAIGRYGAELEYLPAPHHALRVAPAYFYALPGTDDQLTGFGAEVGYRFYGGRHGPHGLFLGASFLVGEYEYIHGNPNDTPLDKAVDTQFVSLGGALDVGYALVVLGNFAVAVGGGAQLTADTLTPQFEFQNHPWHSLLYGPGLRPRALLEVGAAF